MGSFVASEVVKLMNQKGRRVGQAPVLLLGFTFKENCPDIRNTRIIDIYEELIEYGCQVDVYDPWANQEEVMHEYGVEILTKGELPKENFYKAIVLCVAHNEFKDLNIEVLKDGDAVVYDVKGILPKEIVDSRL